MRVVQVVFWWGITLVTLLVLDDLLFGPVFWSLAVVNPGLSTVAAFVASVSFQQWLVHASLRPRQGKFALFFLQRLSLKRKNSEIASREDSLRRTAASVVGALAVTPLIGGVIPILLLNKHQMMERGKLRLFSVLLAVIYACEFALLHGGYGLGAVVRAII